MNACIQQEVKSTLAIFSNILLNRFFKTRDHIRIASGASGMNGKQNMNRTRIGGADGKFLKFFLEGRIQRIQGSDQWNNIFEDWIKKRFLVSQK